MKFLVLISLLLSYISLSIGFVFTSNSALVRRSTIGHNSVITLEMVDKKKEVFVIISFYNIDLVIISLRMCSLLTIIYRHIPWYVHV